MALATGGEDLLRRYLLEVGAHPLLTAADEVELGGRIAAGREAAGRLAAGEDGEELRAAVRDAEAARDRFISSNLRLVLSIAKRYQSSGLALLDLVQEGNIGLMRAVEKFEPERGFKFSTYATWWIRQAVTRAVADKARTIRVPTHVGDALAVLKRVTLELERQHGREPSVAELETATGMKAERIVELRGAVHDVISLSAPLADGEGELADLVPDERDTGPFDAAAARMEQEALAHVLARLSEREQRVLELRFGLAGGQPRTLEDVGREFDLTRERIRQIEAKALTKLRHPCAPPALRQLVNA
jgi:RNA polymerase primary sigma factor